MKRFIELAVMLLCIKCFPREQHLVSESGTPVIFGNKGCKENVKSVSVLWTERDKSVAYFKCSRILEIIWVWISLSYLLSFLKWRRFERTLISCKFIDFQAFPYAHLPQIKRAEIRLNKPRAYCKMWYISIRKTLHVRGKVSKCLRI